MDTGWIAWKSGPECFSFLRTEILSLSRVESDGSCVKQRSDDLRMYSSCSFISLSITPCGLWIMNSHWPISPLNLNSLTCVLSTESAGPLSLEKHRNYDIWLTASVFILQSHLHIHKTCFDINNAPYPILLMWVCACTKEYTAARSKCYFGILYIILVFTTTLYTISIYEYLNELLQF